MRFLFRPVLKIKNIFQKNKTMVLLLASILFASVLRFYKLGSMPINIHVDEVMNGYIGRFIWQNGVDLYGNHWPLLYFNNFGDYPNILPMYLSGAATYLFGINEFAIRLPIAIFGVFAVFLIFVITQKIFRSPNVAFFASLSLAIMPWHVVLSRATAEGITASSVFLGVLYLIMLMLSKRKNWLWLPIVFLLLLTYFLYPSYRVVVPVALLPLIFLAPVKQQKWLFLLVSGCFFALTFFISRTDWGQGRFSQTNFLFAIKPWQETFIAEEGNNNALKARLLFNKPFLFAKSFLDQYGSYYSPRFLFAQGGLPMRYAVPFSGVWYYSYALLLLVWLVVAIVCLKKKTLNQMNQTIFVDDGAAKIYLFIVWLLLISPLAAALTNDDVPNVHRAALMAPLLILVISYCFAWLDQVKIRKNSLLWLFVLPIACETFYFLNMYFVHTNSYQLVYRSSEMKNLAYFLKANEDQYDRIFIEKNGPATVFYLFFNNIFDKSLSQKFQLGLTVPAWKSLRFTEFDCVSPDQITEDLADKKSLFVVKSHCFTKQDPLMLQKYPLREVSEIPSWGNESVKLLTVYELPATSSAQIKDL